MNGILVAAIITAFVVAAVESLYCVQCNSLTDFCDNSNITECPSHANASCTSFMTNTSLGAANIYQDKACSAENCREGRDMVEAFTVHVSDNEHFHFISHCCQGKECNDTSDALAPPLEDVSNNTECLACYGSNESSCNVQLRKCYKEERCVNLVAEFKTETKKLVLRGCSNISNSTCQFLSAENRTVGGVIFLKFECVDSANSSSTAPATTPPASSFNASSAPTSNEPTTPDTGSEISVTPAALVSLLLLGLLF
ncbi:ly6/PLAUR domain-containing protein 8 [Callorhinus ursinus]|uniref:Ly6/PLAUR domain-containing protein 8 n=1 Tax=Callorhinus ursinus TaxID=34884 RepID=A0A3Q7P085_CALUR|nr:ly6/PLAUR domain-containing protein 8 [Callorhinus ursinus]